MKKNLIFDFGNVLGQFYVDRLTAPYVKNEEDRKQIEEVVFDRLYWDQLDRGAITDEEVVDGICSRLPGRLHREACAVYENWVNTMTPVPGMHDLILELKQQGYKLYVLSNISLGFAKSYHTIPWIRHLFELFDGLCLSATVGMAKPDGEIFQYVLDTFGLKAEDSLFIDDCQPNIDGAKSIGIEGYLFDGDVEKLKDFL